MKTDFFLLKNIELGNNKHFSFFVTVICFFVLCYFQNVIGMTIPTYLFLLPWLLCIPFFRRSDFMALGVCYPLMNGTAHVDYILFLAVLVYWVKYGFLKFKIRLPIVLVIVLMCIESLHFVMPLFQIKNYLGYVLCFGYLGLMLNEIKATNNEEIEWIVKAYIIFYLYTMVDILMHSLRLYGDFITFVTSGIRFGNLMAFYGKNAEFQGLSNNENMIALFSIIAVSLCITAIFMRMKYSFFWIGAGVLSIFFGFLTGSRTFVVCLALIFLLSLFYFLKGINIAKLLFIFLFTVFGIMAVSEFEDNLFVSMMIHTIERFYEADVSGGRIGLFIDYNAFWLDNPRYWLFGIGLQNIEEITGFWNTTHNAILETYLCLGIVGLVIVVWLHWLAYWDAQSIRKCRLSVANLIMVVPFYAFIQTIQYVRLPGIFMFTILAAYLLAYRFPIAKE